VVLTIILKIVQPSGKNNAKGSWKAAFMLFLYAITFSYAYLSLETGTGALILFASVQMTMILVGVISGRKLHLFEWLGVIIAFLGFVYLVLPGLATPSLTGFFLMSVSGIAWGFYTLAGKGSENPLSDTSYNFIRCLPLAMILIVISIQNSTLTSEGILLAILSGAITSGIGYTIWYMALGGLSDIRAAVVQLIVPVIAAFGGVLFANEALSMRLVLSSVIILGGILMVILGKHYYEHLISRNS